MGIITSIKVVRLALGLCLLLVPEGSPSLCPHRRQYWHEQREECVNCTACQPGQIVITPCEMYKDAQCGPISELHIDWSALSHRSHRHRVDNLGLGLGDVTPHHHGSEQKHSKHADKNHSRGVHQHKYHRKNHHQPQEIDTFEHEKHKLHSKAHHAHHSDHVIKPKSFQLSRDVHPMYHASPREVPMLPESAALRSMMVVHATPVPFSAVEKLVWDWQAVVLVLAVFACLLFFIVTGIYSIYHARQWRRFKGSCESDVEEAYARRSLMVHGHSEPHAAPPPVDPYAASQGLCMDQLLDRKKQEDLGTPKGNFYIVRDKTGDKQEDSN